MAAHDDKISDNRRKLFKALSAVPVVATLRPGSALANSSAYQCFYNEQNIKGFHKHEEPDCRSGDECYGYKEHNFCDIAAKGRLVKNDRYFPHKLQGTVVEIEGRYWNEDSEDVTDYLREENDGTVTVYNNPEQRRWHKVKTGVPKERGLSLMLVEPVDENYIAVSGNSGRAVNMRIKGPYPKKKLNDGYNQGISQSCLNSIRIHQANDWKMNKG